MVRVIPFPSSINNRPISVGLCVFPRETDYWEEVVHDLYLPSRVAVHSFQTKSYSFPINELRNLALSKATTTHVFISDVDIIPAGMTVFIIPHPNSQSS